LLMNVVFNFISIKSCKTVAPDRCRHIWMMKWKCVPHTCSEQACGQSRECCLLSWTVRAAPGGLRQPEGELHHCGDPREGCERQPTRVWASNLPHSDHRGGRPQPAQARAAGRVFAGRMMQTSLYEPRTWDVPLLWYEIAINSHSSHLEIPWLGMLHNYCGEVFSVSPWRRVTG